MSTNTLLGRSAGHKEHLSPYKLVLLMVLDQHVSILDFMEDSMACSLMITLLELTNTPDMDLKNLLKRLTGILPASAMNHLLSRLKSLQMGSLDKLIDLMNSVPARLLCDPYVSVVNSSSKTFTTSQDPFINKNSVFGLFLRRVNLSFETMTFHESTTMHRQLQAYIHAHLCHTAPASKTDLSSDIMEDEVTICQHEEPLSGMHKCNDLRMPSQRQSEFFIAQQANLLNQHEHQAMSTTDLQSCINLLLHHNPQLIQTRFLQYMNHMRVREYKMSLESLYDYFDHSYLCTQASSNLPTHHDDLHKHPLYRYAALNVAIAHYRFGHREQAILALREAIRIAHQTNDSVCLQYALGWLHRLGFFERNVENPDGGYLLNKLIHAAHSFKLLNIMSLACLSNAKQAFLHAAQPSLVLESAGLSDLSSNSLMTSSSHKASLCAAYGNDELCLMNCLILLLSTSPSFSSSSSSTSLSLSSFSSSSFLPGPQCNNDEMQCLAFCQISKMLAKEGFYEESLELLDVTRRRFSAFCTQSVLWQLCAHEVLFMRCLLRGALSQADLCIPHIATLNGLEGSYCRCLYLAECGDLSGCMRLTEAVMAAIHKGPLCSLQHLFTRCMILKACLFWLLGEASNSLHCFTGAYNLAKNNHYRSLQALSLCNMAALQLSLQRSRAPLAMVKEALPIIFQNQHLLHHASALFIYAKCSVAAAADDDAGDGDDDGVFGGDNGDNSDGDGGVKWREMDDSGKRVIEGKRKRRQLEVLREMAQVMEVACEKFQRVQAFSRLREALIFKALLYHQCGMFMQRNSTSSLLCKDLPACHRSPMRTSSFHLNLL